MDLEYMHDLDVQKRSSVSLEQSGLSVGSDIIHLRSYKMTTGSRQAELEVFEE